MRFIAKQKRKHFFEFKNKDETESEKKIERKRFDGNKEKNRTGKQAKKLITAKNNLNLKVLDIN